MEWLQVRSGLIIRYTQIKYFRIVELNDKKGYSLRMELVDGEELELMVGSLYVLELYLKLLLVELVRFEGKVFHLEKFNKLVGPKLGTGRGIFCV